MVNSMWVCQTTQALHRAIRYLKLKFSDDDDLCFYFSDYLNIGKRIFRIIGGPV